MSVWDRIDKSHRPRPPLKLDVPEIGSPCAKPTCTGVYRSFVTAADGTPIRVICSKCFAAVPAQ